MKIAVITDDNNSIFGTITMGGINKKKFTSRLRCFPQAELVVKTFTGLNITTDGDLSSVIQQMRQFVEYCSDCPLLMVKVKMKGTNNYIYEQKAGLESYGKGVIFFYDLPYKQEPFVLLNDEYPNCVGLFGPQELWGINRAVFKEKFDKYISTLNGDLKSQFENLFDPPELPTAPPRPINETTSTPVMTVQQTQEDEPADEQPQATQQEAKENPVTEPDVINIENIDTQVGQEVQGGGTDVENLFAELEADKNTAINNAHADESSHPDEETKSDFKGAE